MAGLKDFLFGSGTLKKAAGTDSDDKAKSQSQPAGIDIGKMAQEQADRTKIVGAPYPLAPGKSPLSTTMTPIQKKAGK